MKLFCVSDIHSDYKGLIESLDTAGYDKNNKDHCLVVLGDIFDRFNGAVKVYKFLKSIPKSRRILIHGNHDSLLLDLLQKKFPQAHDFSNCTVGTVCQLANDIMNKTNPDFFADAKYFEEAAYYRGYDVDEDVRAEWLKVRNIAKEHPAVKWLKSKDWKNYWEYDKFIFVHCFIPVELKPEMIKKFGMRAYGLENPECFKYSPNWREAFTDQWEEASWGCPWSSFKAGLFDEEAKKGKVLVCGHWHTSDFFKNLKNDSFSKGEIYFSENLIGIDGGVYSMLSPETLDYELIHHQNVLVIDESLKCYNEYGAELKEEEVLHVIETINMTEEEYQEYLKQEENKDVQEKENK